MTGILAAWAFFSTGTNRLAVHRVEDNGVDLLGDKVLQLVHLDGDARLVPGGDQEKFVAGLLHRLLDGVAIAFWKSSLVTVFRLKAMV